MKILLITLIFRCLEFLENHKFSRNNTNITFPIFNITFPNFITNPLFTYKTYHKFSQKYYFYTQIKHSQVLQNKKFTTMFTNLQLVCNLILGGLEIRAPDPVRFRD